MIFDNWPKYLFYGPGQYLQISLQTDVHSDIQFLNSDIWLKSDRKGGIENYVRTYFSKFQMAIRISQP